MAEAAKKTRTEEREVKRTETVEVEYISLELTYAEARTLLAISARIAGYGENRSFPDSDGNKNPSPRMHMDNIGTAISSALGGIDFHDTVEFGLIDDDHKYSNIKFKPYQGISTVFWTK